MLQTFFQLKTYFVAILNYLPIKSSHTDLLVMQIKAKKLFSYTFTRFDGISFIY